MNQFLISSKRLVEAHGESMVYSVVTEGEYDVETGQTINTETAYTVKMYKKHINATQYSYPNLVGKTSAMFYLANTGIAFVPSLISHDLVLFLRVPSMIPGRQVASFPLSCHY